MDILETRLHRTLLAVVNVFFLSVLLIVACLPVLTAFPALAAAFGVVRDWSRKMHTDVVRPFFHHFGTNIGPSLIAGAVWAVTAVSLYINLRLSSQLTPIGFRLPVLIVAIALAVAFLGISVFLFPVMVQYDVSWQGMLRNAVLFAAGQPLIAVGGIGVVVATAVLAWLVPVSLILTTGLAVYVIYRLCDTAFACAEHPADRER